MGITLLQVCCESINFIDVNHTNRSEGFFCDSSIEWEWKEGYKPSCSIEKLVSPGFHTRILNPDGKGFQYGGFT